METYAAPIIVTLFVWWASTGVILYLDKLPRRTFGWSMAGATALMGLALWGLASTSGQADPVSAYLAFLCGILAWAWQLVSYYMGYVTGPRKAPCPPECRGFRRFVEAVRTSLYHEFAILVCGAAIVVLTSGQPNQIGLWTFLILWWMHTSAKLNLHFGAPNLNEELLPEHLRFLVSFMTRKPMNLFFPVSVTLSTIVTVLLALKAGAAIERFDLVGFTILTTLMVLAVAEHWFLVTPLDANALWGWFARDASESVSVRRADEKTPKSELRASALDARIVAEEATSRV